MFRTSSILLLLLFLAVLVFVYTAPLRSEDTTSHKKAPKKTGKQKGGCPPGVWVCRRSRVVLLTRVTRGTHPIKEKLSQIGKNFQRKFYPWPVMHNQLSLQDRLIKQIISLPRRAKLGIPRRGVRFLKTEKQKRIKRRNEDCPVGIWGCKPTASRSKTVTNAQLDRTE